MARVDADALAHVALAPVFLAASMREALQVEELLTFRGVDYVVEVAPIGPSLFGSPRNGAVFYVTVSQAEYCRMHLASAGLEHGVVDHDDALGTGDAGEDASEGLDQ